MLTSNVLNLGLRQARLAGALRNRLLVPAGSGKGFEEEKKSWQHRSTENVLVVLYNASPWVPLGKAPEGSPLSRALRTGKKTNTNS